MSAFFIAINGKTRSVPLNILSSEYYIGIHIFILVFIPTKTLSLFILHIVQIS